MEKKNLDWANLGFSYMTTDYRYVSNYKDGKWDDGAIVTDATVTLNECAGVFQYSQSCFEGLKAYTTEDGHIVCFRPDLNAQRMKDSCERLEMPVFPEDRFIEAVEQVVKANAAWVPPFGSGATLYIRPYMIATNAVIGVKPADEYQFRILVTPVGPYFKGGAKPITIRVSDFDRAAPHGTGHIKAGLNYAMSLHAIVDAHKQGFAENLYLDPATRTYVEETGGANFLFITKDGKFVTPKSDSILPSITRRSLMVVAEKYLNMPVEHRKVKFSEVPDFAECGLCGTAAVISPIGKIVDHGKEICFPSGMEEMGPYTKKLRETLTGIQMAKSKDQKDGFTKLCKMHICVFLKYEGNQKRCRKTSLFCGTMEVSYIYTTTQKYTGIQRTKKENFLDRRTEKIKGAQRLPESKTKETTAQPHFHHHSDCYRDFHRNRSDYSNTAEPCKDNLCKGRSDYRYTVQ